DELVAHEIHVGTIHRFRHLVLRRPGNGGSSQQRPVALGERCVHLLPAELRRTLGARMADLGAYPGFRLAMDEVNDPLPGRLVLWLVEAGATRRYPPFGADAGHLDIDQARTALGALAIMDEVPISRGAVHSAILRHRRDD